MIDPEARGLDDTVACDKRIIVATFKQNVSANVSIDIVFLRIRREPSPLTTQTEYMQ